MPVTLVKKVGANDIKLAPTWRKRWDSNPRAREDYLISSLLVSVSTSGRFVSVSGRFVCAKSRIK